MSLTTRCPACSTTFKVVPDQLRISEGWVRCGYCAEVFDATATLQSLDEPAQPASPVDLSLPDSAPAAQTSSSQPSQMPAAVAPMSTEAVVPEAPVQPPAPPAPSIPATPSAPEAVSEEIEVPLPLSASIDVALGPVEPSLDGSASPPSAQLAAAAAIPGNRRPVEEVEEELVAQYVSFVREAQRQAFWRRTSVRVALGFAGLLLALGLAGQLAYQERDRLATLQPALRPALDSLCGLLGCRIGPVQQIESVSIESSAFNRLRNDVYRLSVSLRNQAEMPVAMPDLELTLTDSQDQPVSRRVLRPAELGSASGVLPASSESPVAVTLAVSLPAGQPRVAGYRLLAFYP